MNIECPGCGANLSGSLEAELPEETDLTISLTITPGQLVRATTLAGVLENFAAIQVETGRAMGCETDVFVAGLAYENDVISVTTRIANVVAQRIEARSDETPQEARLEGRGPDPKGCAQ